MNQKELGKWIERVDTNLDNHITEFTPRLTAVETNQKWLMRFFWGLMTPTLGGIIALILMNL